VNASHPRFNVYGPAADVVEGMQVEKMGMTSGWTTGTVLDDCSDQYSNNSGVWYLCMGISNYLDENGDSGAPVFYWWSEYGVDTVEILGVHSGTTGNADARFSQWNYVIADVGQVDVQFKPAWKQDLTQLATDVSVGANGHVLLIRQ
jgi:hypothetical protein